MYLLSTASKNNKFYNNIIVSDGSTGFKFTSKHRDSELTQGNNIQTSNINSLNFQDAAAKDFRLTTNSTSAIDQGIDLTSSGVTFDYDGNPRPSGSNFDIGAFERSSSNPTANAGTDKSVTLPSNTAILNGSGSSPTGTITSYAWIKLSGGVASLQNAGTKDLTVGNLEVGTYQFQLTVTDDGGKTASDIAIVTVSSPPNEVPTANAGSDKIITLPTNSTTINGSGSDPDGSISSYSWIQVSGPSFNSTGANSATLQLTNLIEGIYVFKLTVTDDDGATDNDNVTINVQASATNSPPTVDGGEDQNIFLPSNSTTLSAIASDTDGTIVSYLWEKVSGSTVTLSNATTSVLTITNLLEGPYVFKITVSDDDGAKASDNISINVSLSNQSPTSNPGSDKSITLPTNTINLNGSGVDADGTIISYEWIKITSLTATLVNASSSALTVENMEEGTHVFGLTVTDNEGATGYAEVTVTVNAGPVNASPQADAGPDLNITLPTANVLISGSGSDSDGSIVTYSWTKVSGPSVILNNSNSSDLNLTNIETGSYVFSITVTDDDGASDIDQMSMVVFPANVNQSPLVNVGENRILTLPSNSITITASVSDPDGSIENYEWTKVTGGDVTLSQNQESLILTNLLEGVYTFKLLVTDNLGATSSDLVTLTVLGSNQAPTVDAGIDRYLILPENSISIKANAEDIDGTITNINWQKVSGASATLANTTSFTLQASNLVEGLYTFEVTVTDDNGSSDTDQVNLTVLPVGSSQLPIVEAGPDQIIFLPTSTVSISGTATDPDGIITSYEWTKTGGSGDLENSTNPVVTIKNLELGQSTFKLTAVDNSGASSTDNVTVTVNPSTTNQPPTASAGGNKNIQLPTNSVTLSGSGTDIDGSIDSYNWSKINGGSATFSSTTNGVTNVSNLSEGSYTFRLNVTDDQGAIASDNAIVNVLPADINKSPISNAGPNQTLVLPQNSTNLLGQGNDADGSIASYKWSKVSGPNSFKLINDGLPTATIEDLVEGIYVFNLSITDNDGATGNDQTTITVSPEGANLPPIADAGGNQFISLPTNTITLYGAGSDNDGSISSYLWTKSSGASADLNNTTTPTLTVSNMVVGSYEFRLRVTDNEGATNDDFVSVIVVSESVNIPPVVTAGTDKIIYLPLSSTTILGQASDQDGTIIDRQWSQISGSATSLSGINSNSLVISNLSEGSYEFRLTAVDDKNASAYDEVSINVLSADSNQAPMVDAGEDVNIYLPENSALLDATVTDNEGNINEFLWSKESGPTATLLTDNQEDLELEDLIEGIYTFELTATDEAGISASDQVTLTVFPIGTNQPPLVDAGKDSTIFLPQNNITIFGLATDNDGSIETVSWSLTNGPTQVVLTGADTETLTVENLIEGNYTFQLEAIDNSGASGTDEIQLTVNSELPNQPPLIFAGANMELTLPIETITLNATASDEDGTVESVFWQQFQGEEVTISSTSTLETEISNILNPGVYGFRVTATDNEGALGVDEILLFVFDPDNRKSPIAFAGEDIVLIPPNTSLERTGVATDPDGTIEDYIWRQTSGDALNFEYIDSVLYVTDAPKGSYKFAFEVIDNDTLSAFDEFELRVTEFENALNPPMFFSPNGDGIGDFWEIENIEVYETCKLTVFSRSGVKVFEAEPYANNWDGTYRGTKVSDGDYYYIFQCNGENIKSGALRIIR
ncbi:tandem-95 repeat protein [Fulvivirga lutimaris]|nr:tandem-95 repeat protein [Fulvivirga lutimaris]